MNNRESKPYTTLNFLIHISHSTFKVRCSTFPYMPLLRITTNQTIASEIQIQVLKKLSAETASLLGKSENYVMTAWLPQTIMTFGAQTTPTAYIELDSIGLKPEQATQLSQALCAIIADHTDIEPGAIYIKFYDAARALWGWNGETFAQ